MKTKQPSIGFCPRYHRAIELIGRRWTGVILQALLNGETPVRIEYRLTDKGEALGEVVNAVSHWAHDWLPAESDSEAVDEHHACAPGILTPAGSTAS